MNLTHTLIIRTALVAGAILLSQSVLAAPVLRDTVTVNSRIVTVGDMFEGAGALAETALFRAPAPGTAGQVGLAAIRNATLRVGLADFENPGLDQVLVSRVGTPVTENDLNTLIAIELRTRNLLPRSMSVRMNIGSQLPMLNAAASDVPVRLTDLRYLSGSTYFSARFELDGVAEPLVLSGNLQFSIEAPHLTRPLSEGAVISADDITMRPVAVGFADSTGTLAFEDVVGKQTVRRLREGIIVRPADVSNPLVIARNDEVTLLLQAGVMTLTVRGQALNDASRGDTISVLNLVSNRVVRGIAINPGTVEISQSNPTLASL